MPTIEKDVNGWKISIYADDHNPAHLHASKAGINITVNLIDLAITAPVRIGKKDRDALTTYVIDNQDDLIAEFNRLTK